MNRIRPVVLTLSAVMLLAACQSAPPDRAGRLLSMAGEEAASIGNKLDRLGRQLNIADTQIRTGRAEEGDKTLLLARDTLASAGKGDLDDFHRIAAWTSISQLARRAKDRDLALKSSDLALAALNDVMPANQRPQYVLSLAGELADLRGKDAAIELINSGGAWAAEIIEPGVRRQALVAFARSLLAYDAYENARTMLRRDQDAVWRTDTFLALANGSVGYYNRGYMAAAASGGIDDLGFGGGRGGGAGGAGRGMAPASVGAFSESNVGGTFGRDVRFESVYQQNH